MKITLLLVAALIGTVMAQSSDLASSQSGSRIANSTASGSASPTAPVSASRSGSPSPSASSTVPVLSSTNDLWALQYMYVLERLDRDFFNSSLSAHNSSQDFIDAGYNAQVSTYLNLMSSQIQVHLDTITSLILMRNGTIPPNCTFEFNVTSTTELVQMSSVLQNLMVEAYDGVINRISDAYLSLTAVTIATVKARHASYLNFINEQTPFPSAFDTALPPSNASATIFADYITTCPTNLNLPIPRNETVPQTTYIPSNVYANSTSVPRSSSTSNATISISGVGPYNGNDASGLSLGFVSVFSLISFVAAVVRQL